MDKAISDVVATPKNHILRIALILFGFAFLIIGLGVTAGIIYASYTLAIQPDPISTLLSHISAGDDVFIKWVINDQADEIGFSRIILLIFAAIALSVVIQAIISFITMCISSGKGLLNISRNFDD